MSKSSQEKLEFARNTWLFLISAVTVYKLLMYIASPSFTSLVSSRGMFNALFLLFTMFLLIYAIFIAPALMMHVILWEMRHAPMHK